MKFPSGWAAVGVSGTGSDVGQPTGRFVPERKVQGLAAIAQGQAGGRGERRFIADHVGQAIEGDPAAKVVDMMVADVGGEPSQHARKFELGTPPKRRFSRRPGLIARPIRAIKLVLDVK